MRLERSVFSIRPLSFAFQVDKRSALPGEILDSGCNFHQKWVCNCPKDSYNLADRASIAIPDWRTPKPAPLKPEAPHKQPFIVGVKVDPPAMARSGGLDGAGKGASNWNYGGHEAPRTMATAANLQQCYKTYWSKNRTGGLANQFCNAATIGLGKSKARLARDVSYAVYLLIGTKPAGFLPRYVTPRWTMDD